MVLNIERKVIKIRNWKVVLWLILFFPVGIYLMFMYSDWKKPLKYGITGFFILIMFAGGVEFSASLLFLGSFFSIPLGLFSLFRKKSRRRGLATLVLAILVLIATDPIVDEQLTESKRIEQIELEAQAEADRIAEEERLEEVAQKEEQQRREEEKKQLEEEKKLKEEIVEAIEVVEEYPTQNYYNRVLKLLDQLEKEDSVLIARLEELLPAVEEYEKQADQALEAVELAEEEKDRDFYNEAFILVAELPVSSKHLTRRLTKLDEKILEIEEEERLAAEKAAEEEQIAAEKAAEKERIAAEKAAEEKRIASERAAEKKRKEAAEKEKAKKVAAQQAAKKQAAANTKQSSSSSSSNGSSNSSSSSSQAKTPAPISTPGQYVDENGNGLIKGSSSGIYHTPGSTYYNKTTKPVAWFKTVEDAKNAGYRAPKR